MPSPTAPRPRGDVVCMHGCIGLTGWLPPRDVLTASSCGVEKTIKKFQNTKKTPTTAWRNEDFDLAVGKFRRRGAGAAAADEDEDSEDDSEDEGKGAKGGSRGAKSLFPPGIGRGKKRAAAPALPSLMEARPPKRHSNPRKAALAEGVFAMPGASNSIFPKGGGGMRTSSVQPVLTPSLAASLGMDVSDSSSLAQNLLDISTADITGGSARPRRVTRSNSGTPSGGGKSVAPFSAGFTGSGSSDGLSPWLMSAVSSIEAPVGAGGSNPPAIGMGSPDLGLTPTVVKFGTARGGGGKLGSGPIFDDAPAKGRATRNRSK